MKANWKIARVQPGSNVLPYIKGTEEPNYYLVLGDGPRAIWGFRPLKEAVPAVGSTPGNGVQTRFRVVVKDQKDVPAFKAALAILNFEVRDYGDGFIHFSTVVSDAAAFAGKVEKLLSLQGCF